jgi:hypothetical protein
MNEGARGFKQNGIKVSGAKVFIEPNPNWAMPLKDDSYGFPER